MYGDCKGCWCNAKLLHVVSSEIISGHESIKLIGNEGWIFADEPVRLHEKPEYWNRKFQNDGIQALSFFDFTNNINVIDIFLPDNIDSPTFWRMLGAHQISTRQKSTT